MMKRDNNGADENEEGRWGRYNTPETVRDKQLTMYIIQRVYVEIKTSGVSWLDQETPFRFNTMYGSTGYI